MTGCGMLYGASQPSLPVQWAASLAGHRQFLIYTGLGMALITVGLMMQGWEAGAVIWRQLRRRQQVSTSV